MIALLLIAAGLLALAHRAVHRFDDRIVRDLKLLDTSAWPRPRVAVVFGASVYSNGDLSPLLEDRVSTAIELYRSGKVDRILVSGDNRARVTTSQRRCRKYLLTTRLPRAMCR
jgi:SanA protein